MSASASVCTPLGRCQSCSTGMVRVTSGAGRFLKDAHGVDFELPIDLQLPQCDRCGDTWVNAEIMPRLFAAEAHARQQRRSAN